MKELLQYIAESLVDHPEKVQVIEKRRGRSVTYKLRVAPEDMGRVIGREGRVANAMRQLLRAAATRARVRAYLDIED